MTDGPSPAGPHATASLFDTAAYDVDEDLDAQIRRELDELTTEDLHFNDGVLDDDMAAQQSTDYPNETSVNDTSLEINEWQQCLDLARRRHSTSLASRLISADADATDKPVADDDSCCLNLQHSAGKDDEPLADESRPSSPVLGETEIAERNNQEYREYQVRIRYARSSDSTLKFLVN